MSGDDENRQCASVAIGPQEFAQFVAIQQRQLHIHHDGVWRIADRFAESITAIACVFDSIAVLREYEFVLIARAVVLIDHQHESTHIAGR